MPKWRRFEAIIFHITLSPFQHVCRSRQVPGGSLEDSEVLKGVMLNKDVTHAKMRRRIENPRIVLLDCPLEYKKGESQVCDPSSPSPPPAPSLPCSISLSLLRPTWRSQERPTFPSYCIKKRSMLRNCATKSSLSNRTSLSPRRACQVGGACVIIIWATKFPL